MAFGQGKTAILRDLDKQFVDRIMQGEDRRAVFEELFPNKCIGRTNKQIYKSIEDILKKPKVKEYKESLEAKAEEALNNAIQDKANSIAGKIMEEEELMVLYTEIARDEDANLQWRLKAMDSIAKYIYGLDKRKLEVDANIQQVIFSGEDEFNDEEEDE